MWNSFYTKKASKKRKKKSKDMFQYLFSKPIINIPFPPHSMFHFSQAIIFENKYIAILLRSNSYLSRREESFAARKSSRFLQDLQSRRQEA